jgi:hypothetical protein
MRKMIMVWDLQFGFQGLLTPDAKHYTTSNAESQSYEKGKGPIQYPVPGFGFS